MRQTWVGRGWPTENVEFMLSMFRVVCDGGCAEVTSSVQTITSRPPIRLEQSAHENVSAWA